MNYKTKRLIKSNLSHLLCELNDDSLFILKDLTEEYIEKFSIENKVSKGEVVQTLYKNMRKSKKRQQFSEYLVEWFPELLCREDIERPTYGEVSLYYDMYGEDSKATIENTIRNYCKKYNVPIKEVIDELNLRMKSRRPGFNSKNLEEWFPDVYEEEFEQPKEQKQEVPNEEQHEYQEEREEL